jgi:2'-5' RNA ligase
MRSPPMTAQAETKRLFAGIPLPLHLVGHVRQAQGGLPRDRRLRLIPEDRLHVTLCFLGEVGEEACAGAVRVVSELPCTMGGVVELGGCIYLPSSGRARVVALELTDRDGIVADLFEAVAAGLEREAGYVREKRPFRPHLTIGRYRQPVRVELSADVRPVAFAVGSVCLYESRLSHSGAQYTVLETAEFDVSAWKTDL